MEIKRLIDSAYETVFEILINRREVMEHLTRELLEKEVMEAKQIEDILVQYKTGPRIAPGTGGTFTPPPALPLPGDEPADRGDLRADA